MTSLSTARSHLLAAVYDPFLALGERRGMSDNRRALLATAAGRVLEIGAGTGANLIAYPPDLDALVVTEPDPGMVRRLKRNVARHRPEAEVLCVGAESLPFPDGAFDVVVSTLVLCTVPDPAAAVTEARRVLRPGGRLLYVEHVRSEDARLARRQDRLASPWRAFAAGCRCNQSTLDVLSAAFELEPPTRATWLGMPSIVHPLVTGAAVVPVRSCGASCGTADAGRRADELTEVRA
ncbi:MAG TPA: class I SAM-dependent methyltransferase [Blastococcus sp.]|nr:class I SAM-dependent methyltransferase [Blastococcus sp.]